MQDLLDIGFEPVGRWVLADSQLRLVLDRWHDVGPALYAFVIDGEVMYVGKIKRTLGQRLYGYLKGSGTQRTNIRVRGDLIRALQSGTEVQILGFQNSESRTIGKFRLSLPAGLEDDIIHGLDPPWNGGRQPIPPVHAETPVAGDKSLEQDVDAQRQSAGIKSQEANEGAASSFIAKVGKAYLNQGFFNIPVRYGRLLGPDGAGVAVDDPETGLEIMAKINRSANPNGTPRILGGVPLRKWIQRHSRFGGELEVTVLGHQHIRIKAV